MNILAKKSKAKGSTLLKSFKGLSVNPGADGDERWWQWRYCNSSGLKCMSFKQRLSTCEITSRSWNLQIPYTPNISFEANMISNKPRQSWWDNANLSNYNTSFSFKNISLSRRNGKISYIKVFKITWCWGFARYSLGYLTYMKPTQNQRKSSRILDMQENYSQYRTYQKCVIISQKKKTYNHPSDKWIFQVLLQQDFWTKHSVLILGSQAPRIRDHSRWEHVDIGSPNAPQLHIRDSPSLPWFNSTYPRENLTVSHSPWKVTETETPIGKDRLPTTIFQGRAVKLRGGNWKTPGNTGVRIEIFYLKTFPGNHVYKLNMLKTVVPLITRRSGVMCFFSGCFLDFEVWSSRWSQINNRGLKLRGFFSSYTKPELTIRNNWCFFAGLWWCFFCSSTQIWMEMTWNVCKCSANWHSFWLMVSNNLETYACQNVENHQWIYLRGENVKIKACLKQLFQVYCLHTVLPGPQIRYHLHIFPIISCYKDQLFAPKTWCFFAAKLHWTWTRSWHTWPPRSFVQCSNCLGLCQVGCWEPMGKLINYRVDQPIISWNFAVILKKRMKKSMFHSLI